MTWLANVRVADVRADLSSWFGDEAETRVEPGGVLLLVGQRLGPDDLFRDRLDVSWVDASGDHRRKYTHIVYPAHRDESCDGEHRQWDGGQDGCLLDSIRLPMSKLEMEQQSNPRKFRFLYQQEDIDPAGALVMPEWIEGREDRDKVQHVGCYDDDRGFNEWPSGVSNLVDVVSVDPAAGGFWGIRWWAVQPKTHMQYLIRGIRSRSFRAGDLLDSGEGGKLTGIMQSWQEESVNAGHPIRAWVIEGNSAFKLLVQFDHFRRWEQQWPSVQVILHRTQDVTKNDAALGVEGLLPSLYRQGLVRLPHKRGDMEAFTFVQALKKEVTQYPEGATSDLVMSHWQMCWNLEKQVLRLVNAGPLKVDVLVKIPPYLQR